MPIVLHPMQLHDLDQVLLIQEEAFGPDFVESRSVFEDKLRYHPAGCWVAALNDQRAAYLLSHPAHLAMPPACNTLLDRALAQFDCYFIHDVAVRRTARGMGVASQLAQKAIELAQGLGYDTMTLIAVQRSQGFWNRFGFVPAEVTRELEQKIQRSYGGGACYMVRRGLT